MDLNHLKIYISDPLYNNSIYIILSRLLNIGGGFIFWVIAAKLYKVEDVGLATVLISSVTTILLVSILGFDSSLIRFIHSEHKGYNFNTALTISTISSIILGAIYVLLINYISPNLYFLRSPLYGSVFIFFVAINSIFLITGTAFKAIRRSDYFFYQNILLNLRIPLLFIFLLLGNFGIFSAFGFATLVSSLFSVMYLKKFFYVGSKISTQFLRSSLDFSFANYISNIFNTLPTLIFPLLIFNLLGSQETGIFSIAFSIGNLPLIVSDALGTSLFVEGSHGKNLSENISKSLLLIYLLLIPTILFICIFSNYILGFYGKEYVEASSTLRIMAVSCLFIPVYSLYVPIQNVKMKLKSVIKVNFYRFVILMILSYVFIFKFGVIGIGYAWLITHGFLLVGIGVSVLRDYGYYKVLLNKFTT